MKQNEILNEILQMVLQRELGKSIRELENYLLTHPQQQDMEQLIAIRDDYQLMVGYWQRGFDDPEREHVCDQLLRRMYVLTSNIAINWQLAESAFLRAVHLRPRRVRQDWSMTAVRADMEAFVSDVALLDLPSAEETTGGNRQQRSADLYRQHFELMRDLFDYIITSRQWRASLGDAFLDMLLSPTLASIDQELIVSAITLSAMQLFCFQKFRVLCEVYRQATDEPLRQRALVGWVLTASAPAARLYTEMESLVSELCADERTRNELAELQMQLVYCQQADADRDTIQNEILPDIMSGSKLKMTGKGLVEMDEDQLDDILHPEASEQAMERMEQSMQRMVDMQKQGADIYFGGFSQMKRFPFFNDISNWFVPFYSQHPGISETWNNARGGRFLKTITRLGAFCDSDKYSFVLAFNMVLDRLPKNLLQMIEQGEATAMPVGGEVPMGEQNTPAFIRRVYLQNLYRFFRLFPTRSEFSNPFDHILFFDNPLIGIEALAPQHVAVARFLMKRRRYAEAVSVLESLNDEQRDVQYYILLGTALQHVSPLTTPFSPLICYQRALELEPGNERAQAGLARALYGSGQYENALDAYERLLAMQPDSKSYQQGAAVCLLNLERADEALKLLYKLNYLYPDDLGISRLLAWALTVGGKYEQAGKLYDQLLAIDQPLPADMLNYGYCLWFAGNIVTAIGMFRQFLSSQQEPGFSLEKEFLQTEHQLIVQRGIGDTEILLMLDAVQ